MDNGLGHLSFKSDLAMSPGQKFLLTIVVVEAEEHVESRAPIEMALWPLLARAPCHCNTRPS
jgi:hypothetical protein